MRLMPARSPKPACRVVPRMPMKMSGNAKSATMRCRSRRSLMKSRCASARIAEASVTALAHDLEVGVLEAWGVCLDDGQRRLDGPKDRVNGVPIKLELEGRSSARQVSESRELVTKSRAIVGVHEHVVLDQIALDLVRRAERDDATLVEDADAVGLLGLLEVVGRQEDGRAARAAHLGKMLPERAAAGHVEPRGRLVQEEHLGIVQEAPHDLELSAHSARERTYRFVDVARDAEELRELFDLRAVFAIHERVRRCVWEEAVEERVEAHVLLGGQVLIEARALEDDPDLAADRARLADDVASIDGRASAGRRKRGRQDRDRRRLPRPVRAQQHEEFPGLDLEGNPIDRVLLGLLVALDELLDADHAL